MTATAASIAVDALALTVGILIGLVLARRSQRRAEAQRQRVRRTLHAYMEAQR